jgi:2-iminoacetate synthase
VSFVETFHRLPLGQWRDRSNAATPDKVLQALQGSGSVMQRFMALVSPEAENHLEQLCHASKTITQQRFGKVIRLFAPLYLSNECINNCQYCGFSRDNPILRVTLEVDEGSA